MKIYLYSILTLLLFYVFTSDSNGQTAITEHGQLRVSGNQILNERDEPAQLQGMSLFWSQWPEGAPFYNAEVIEWLRDDWCINIIRAAMAVEASGGYVRSATNAEREEAKVRTVVEAAIDLDIYVIIDWHSHEAEKYTEEAASFFARMARDYGDYPNVIYETYNEPIEADWEEDIKPYTKTVVDSIRKYDPDNIIVCGTPYYCQRVDVAAASPLKIEGEANIAYSFHFYAGSHSSLLGRVNNAIKDGLPIIITEYGTVNADGDGGVSTFQMGNWFDLIDDNNIIHCNWSVSDKYEGASIVKPGSSPTGNWEPDELTESGVFVRRKYVRSCPNYRFPVSNYKQENPSTFRFYPNPVADNIYLENHEGHWELFSSTGQHMLSGEQAMIDVSQLPEGVYFLKANGYTQKVIKQ